VRVLKLVKNGSYSLFFGICGQFSELPFLFVVSVLLELAEVFEAAERQVHNLNRWV
jgi:hypothetical protein